MAYSKSTIIPLSGSVSLQSNNLSYSGDHVAYIRLNEVVLVSIITGESRKMPISTKCVIYQASLFNVCATELLVIASSEGTQIWTVDGMELKFFLPLNTSSNDLHESHFSKGITATENGYICTGTSSGNIVVINVPSRGGEGITFFDNLETKESPISSLGSSIVLVACGNDNGDIFGFDPNSAFERVCRFNGLGFPCTSIAVKDDYIFASFMNGKIRLYRPSVQELSIEISAHSRTINALTIHPAQYLAASVGDDQILHVWTLPDYSSGSYSSSEVNLFCSCSLENKKLTGVTFLSDDRIGVVAYDDDELTIFSRN